MLLLSAKNCKNVTRKQYLVDGGFQVKNRQFIKAIVITKPGARCHPDDRRDLH